MATNRPTGRRVASRVAAASAAGVIVSLGGVVLTAPPATAAADTPGCVTVREYRQVDLGMTKKQVHRIFDTSGRLGDGGGGGFTRTYRECDDPTPSCVVLVEYEVRGSGLARVEAKERDGACAG